MSSVRLCLYVTVHPKQTVRPPKRRYDYRACKERREPTAGSRPPFYLLVAGSNRFIKRVLICAISSLIMVRRAGGPEGPFLYYH